MKRFIILSVLSLLLAACGNKPPEQENDQQPAAAAGTAMSEEEIALQLSSYLIADPQDQGGKEQNAIVDYAINKGIPLERTQRGIFYRVLEAGEGDLLEWGDYIRVHYKGYFLDGKVFDDTRVREKPLEFYIGNMIAGWNFGLQHVAPGGTIQLLVPSPLAYGEEGLPNAKGGLLVPPNTPLVFEVEVLERLKEGD